MQVNPITFNFWEWLFIFLFLGIFASICNKGLLFPAVGPPTPTVDLQTMMFAASFQVNYFPFSKLKINDNVLSQITQPRWVSSPPLTGKNWPLIGQNIPISLLIGQQGPVRQKGLRLWQGGSGRVLWVAMACRVNNKKHQRLDNFGNFRQQYWKNLRTSMFAAPLWLTSHGYWPLHIA